MRICVGNRSWACTAVLVLAVVLAAVNVISDAPAALQAAALAALCACLLAAAAFGAARIR